MDGAHECHSSLADGLRADLARSKAGVASARIGGEDESLSSGFLIRRHCFR